MTIYTPNSSGNWNTAAIWDTVAQIGAVGSSANVTTAGLNTETWTAPNLLNFVTGAWVCMLTTPAAGRDWTLELLVSGVPSGVIATILQTNMPVSNGTDAMWVYFRLPTPVAYATLAAGAYRFNLKSTVANSGTVYNNAAATGVMIMPTDDRHAVPNGVNQVFIGPHNCTTPITVTVDGTSNSVTAGTGVSGSNPVVRNPAQASIIIGGSATAALAVLKPDTAADSTLSVAGHCAIQQGGAIEYGTIASPHPAAYTATFQGSLVGLTNLVISTFGNGYITGVSGRNLTFTRTTFVSGLGTAASPLVTADAVDWNVGDKICVAASSNNAANYNESENRFIITKNSSTSYVVSNTKGGAENALVNTHTTSAVIVNLTRGVVFQNTFAAGSITFNFNSATTDDSVLDWVNLNNIGALNGTPIVNATFPPIFGIWAPSTRAVPINNCVFDLVNAYGFICNAAVPDTFTGNIFANSVSNNSLGTCAGLGVTSSAVGHTFDDFLFINNQRQAVEYRGVNCVFNNPVMNSCNKLGLANQGAFNPISAPPFTMNNPDLNCNRGGAFAMSGIANATVYGGTGGTKGYNNTAEVSVQASTANTNMLFQDFVYGSPTLVSGHTGGAVGATEILFDRLNATANRHVWYTEFGSAQSTGAGLPDTNVRTSGTLNVRIAPENSANGFQLEYLVLARPGQAVTSFLFIEKNAAFAADDVTVELFLPGSTVADATANVDDSTGVYNVYTVSANYLGSVPLYARIRITAKSTTPAAYIYLADIANGTNDIINLKTWYRAKPSTIMFDQLGDPASVWAQVLDGGFTAQGIMRLLAAFAAGNASGMDTVPIFKSLDGTKDRIAGTISGQNRTVTGRDVT